MKSIMHDNLSNYSVWSIYIIHIEYLHNAFIKCDIFQIESGESGTIGKLLVYISSSYSIREDNLTFATSTRYEFSCSICKPGLFFANDLLFS